MSYPELPYPAYVSSWAHPDCLAVQARLRGLDAPPPQRCRMLELGCGAGWSLLTFGYALPESEFVGVDLTAQAIENGRERVNRLGLRNVHLRAGDVMDIDEEDGQFDYIVAHGFISWVPDHVRGKVFEICRDRLAPNGVAYLSYNTYPGGHMREMLGGMLKFHTRALTGDVPRMTQAHALMQALTAQPTPETPYHAYLDKTVKRSRELPPQQILFDEMSDINRQFYFHEIASMALAHGLQFLDEAEFTERLNGLSPSARTLLERMDDRIIREQYEDFFHGRAFRQSLFCRASVPLQARQTSALRGLRIASPMVKLDEEGERWTGGREGKITISHPPTQAAFARLGAAWPGAIPFEELLPEDPEDAAKVAGVVMQCVGHGAVRAHVHPPGACAAASERPRASALARSQAGQALVPNLAGEAIALSDEFDARLLGLLDGSRTRDELARDMAPATGEEVALGLQRLGDGGFIEA